MFVLDPILMKSVIVRVAGFIAVMVVCLGFRADVANGGTTIQPASASTTVASLFSAGHTIDQSGLSTGYTSGVTDFNTYITSGPTAFHGFGANVWAAAEGIRSGNFDFGLGGTYPIDAMAFWNAFNDPSAVRQFNILVDDNTAFSSPVDLGTFTASNTLGTGGNTAAEVFTFAATSASFVRLRILNTWSGSSYSIVSNEAAFRASSVPEPSTLISAGIAGLSLFGMIRRRSSRA